MPRNYLMTWNGKTRRWFKKHNQKQHAVACESNRANCLARLYPDLYVAPTKEGSYRAANRWWEERIADIEGPKKYKTTGTIRIEYDPPRPADPDTPPIVHNGVVYQAEAIPVEAATINLGAVENPAEAFNQIVSRARTGGEVGCELIRDALAKFLVHKKTEVGQSITIERFDIVKRQADLFAEFVGLDKAVASINAAMLADYRSHLITKVSDGDMEAAYAASHLQVAKQFVGWAYELEILASLPRNFSSKKLNIKIPTKKVVTYSMDELRQLFGDAVERTRLYMLLVLNTGMTQQDISDLLHSETDLKLGTITRKRSKTGDHGNVPEVTYILWPETLALLRNHTSKSGDNVLLNRNGGTLITKKLGCNGKLRKTDAISLAFKHIKTKAAKKGLRALRKTSSSMLADDERFATISELYLGHAAASVADKHYNDTPQKLLAKGLAWLREQYQDAKVF